MRGESLKFWKERILAIAPELREEFNRRIEAHGVEAEGLKSRSRAPKSCPHKTKPALEARVVLSRG